MRSRSAVALVGFRVVSQLVSKSTACHVHVHVVTILTLKRPTEALPAETKSMRHFHQGTQTDPITETSQFFLGGGTKNSTKLLVICHRLKHFIIVLINQFHG